MASSQIKYMLSGIPIGQKYIDDNWHELIIGDLTPDKHLLPWNAYCEDHTVCYLVSVECPFDEKMKPRFVSCVKVDPFECRKPYMTFEQFYEAAHGQASDPIFINGRKGSADHSSEMLIPPGGGSPMATPTEPGGVAQ